MRKKNSLLRTFFVVLAAGIVLLFIMYLPAANASKLFSNRIGLQLLRPFNMIRYGIVQAFSHITSTGTPSLESLVVDKAAFETLKKENDDLKKVLAYQESTKAHVTPADIIGSFAEDRDEYLILQQSGNIAEGDEVLSPGGTLLGFVRTSSSGSVTARLLSSPSETLAVQILPSGVQGILRGDNNGEYIISLVPQSAEVHTGDVVVAKNGTSNGRPVGLVVSAMHRPSEAFLDIRAKSSMSAMFLDRVMIQSH